ncbi:MAG: TonB-dependent receptor plug domain-containing protein, partial [Candidatus Margulisiibacteriota bacterium]
MVNGHYYNEDIYGGSYTNHTFGIDLDLVKRIEVIRGPSSALYGTNAFFAVINVVTKTAKEIEGISVSAGYGINNTTAGSVRLGNKSKDLNTLVVGSVFNSDGYRVLYFPEFDTRENNRGIAQNLDWEKANNFFAHLNWGNFSFMANTSYREKAFPTAAYSTIFNDPRASDIDKRSFVEMKFQPKISKDKSGLLRFYYDQYAYIGNYPYDYPPPTLNRDYSEGNWWGSEAQLSWDLTPTNKLIAGAEYQNHPKVLLQNFDVDPYNLILDENRPFSLWSLYLQDELKFEKLGLNLGLRTDHYPEHPNILNPRLGLVFNPFADHYLKILYGRAFRIPNSFEKYYADQSTSVGNPNLKP